MKCLVTGFEAFGNFAVNPSEEVIQLMPGELTLRVGKALNIERSVLPCCCKQMWQKLAELVGKKSKPLLLVMTGLASDRDTICLERFALNISDYRIPDNRGHQPKDKLIKKKGPVGLQSNVPLELLEKRLNRKGFRTDISNYAGSYLCNEIYYQALSTWQKKHKTAILFVHIPDPDTYAKRHRTGLTRAETLKQFALAIEDIVRFSYNWLKR